MTLAIDTSALLGRYLSGPHRAVVLEAMAAGRPVVATPAGAQGIGAGPGLVVAEDFAAAAAEIVWLLSDEGMLQTAGAAARDRVVADFSWSANAHAVEQLWQRVAA